MSDKNTLRNIVIILLLLVLIPTAFYTVYEFSTLNTNEQILSEMYNRQLEAILFSVNEHAWAVVNSRASSIARTLESDKTNDKQSVRQIEQNLRRELQRNLEIKYLIFSDSSGKNPAVIGIRSSQEWSGNEPARIESTLVRNSARLQRLSHYMQTNYRKLEPLYFGSRSESDSQLILAFAIAEGVFRNQFVGIALDELEFIRHVVGQKLIDIAGKEFILGVIKKSTNEVVFTTEEIKPSELRQQKTLWLFPNYDLGIRLKGTTIDELAQSRTKRNLMLVLLMDVVLLAGAWFVYKSIHREMELVRLKSDFVSNVSHELRTPLALIRMYGETLEMGRVKSEEKKQEYYGTIVKESERLTRLVNNILDFSKMEAGKKQYAFSEVQLNDLVRNVMATYDFHLKDEGVAPIVELDQSLPTISADVEAVTEAIVNLIDNAVKYSRENKFLRVKTLQQNACCVVEVHDHGIGIAEEHRTKIFDKFFRVGSSLVHNTKGSGLGLALVKHIMDAHGGQVEVGSIVGKGSTFRLVFPA